MAGPPLHVHALRRLGYAPLRRPAANTWAGQRRRYSNASSSSSDSTTPEWMSLTQQFYSTLSALESQPTNLSPARVHRLHNAAYVAIQSCLEVHRPSEALGIHGALTKSGILGSSPRIDALALKALQATPHQSHQAKVVSCLIAAEGMDGEDTQTAPTELMEFPILRAERTSPAEYFRISVAKNMSLLHTVRELLGPLGVRYALSQMAAVLDCPSLRKEVEVRPLLEISQAVLWHPFAYERPSASWAQHTGRFSASGIDIRRYSASQAKGVASMVAFIEPSRAWCTNALSFVSTLGQGWDALLLRRVAQSLVLPEESHNIFPSSHRYRSRRGVCGPTTQGSLWADPKHSVFGEAQADAQRTPRQRSEYILKRRTKHDILVPDTAFTLTHFHQLEQLAKHREVLITHSVFLELLGVATRLNDPQRFHARRILQYFMHHATTAAFVQPSPAKGSLRNRHRNHAAVSRHTQAHHAHVTILGIQDELFILDSCPERFIFGDALSSSLRHTSAKLPEVSSGTLSTILVAKQIERFISASEKGISFFDPTNKELLEELEDESLVEAIVREAERTTEATAHQSREAPLFKSRSRRYWSRLPLVLATTTPAVRAAAYTVDVKMFPPAACQ